MRLANRALDDCRRRTQNDATGHRGRRGDPLYTARELLLAGAERLDVRGRDKMREALDQGDPYDEVADCWAAKEKIRSVFKASDPEQASDLLDDAIDYCAAPEAAPELHRLARTLNRWRTETETSTSTGAHNGRTEAANPRDQRRQTHRQRLPELRRLPAQNPACSRTKTRPQSTRHKNQNPTSPLKRVEPQNLFHLAKRAWAPADASSSSQYAWPSYDVEMLAGALVSRVPGRVLSEVRFYTGVPDRLSQRFWHIFWTNKLRHLRNRGVYVYAGRVNSGGQEKGVDVSLALDLVQATHEQRYEVAIIVSQDWDFGPAVRLAKAITQSQGRNLAFESAFPVGPGSSSNRGVPGTRWVPIDKATYDACRDPRDYRPTRR
ncbi:MAG: transposase [bacterium]|nr:transposase [bacterium]